MTGESEALSLPDPPRIGAALRGAASDFFYNSWRLVPGNAIWGALLIALLLGTATWPPLIALVFVLALPVAGLYQMAALITRGEAVGFSDFVAGMRRHAGPALGVGAVAILLAVVFTANVFIGLDQGGIVGWVFSALSLYALLFLAMYLVAVWPLLVDPRRAELPLRRRLTLAALVNVARPGRMAALTCIIGVLLVLSLFLFAALLTVSIAYLSLVATRYVLPAADRLEGRLTVRRADEG